MLNRRSDLGRDMQRRFVCVHHYQEIHITILSRLSIGVGTEENNLLWMELLNNLPGHAADPFQSDREDWRALFVCIVIGCCWHIVCSVRFPNLPPAPFPLIRPSPQAPA